MGTGFIVYVLLYLSIAFWFAPVKRLSRYSYAIDVLGELANHFPRTVPAESRMYFQRGFAHGSTWLYLQHTASDSEFEELMRMTVRDVMDESKDAPAYDIDAIPRFNTGDTDRPDFPHDFSDYTIHVLGGKDGNAAQMRYGVSYESNSLSVVYWIINAPW